jgi:hypothetical protein
VGKRGLAGVLLGLAVAAGVWYGTSWRRSEPTLSFLRLCVNDLRGRVEKERAASAEAVEKYQPTATGKVDDLGRPPAFAPRRASPPRNFYTSRGQE